MGVATNRAGIAAFVLALVSLASPLASAGSALAQEGTTGSGVVPIRGTEGFWSAETRDLEGRIAADEARVGEIESRVEALKDEGAVRNRDEVKALEREKKQVDEEWGRLEEDLAAAKLRAIRDASEGSSAGERLASKEEKRDALEALNDWTKEFVGLGGEVRKDVREELESTEEAAEQLGDQAAQEEQEQREGTEEREDTGTSSGGSTGGAEERPPGSPGPSRPSEDAGGIGPGGVLLFGAVIAGGILFAAGRKAEGAWAKVRRSLNARLVSVKAPGEASAGGTAPPPEQENREHRAGGGGRPEPSPVGGGQSAEGPLCEDVGPRTDGPADGDQKAGETNKEEPADAGPAARECPECGNESSPKAKFCKKCGSPF